MLKQNLYDVIYNVKPGLTCILHMYNRFYSEHKKILTRRASIRENILRDNTTIFWGLS